MYLLFAGDFYYPNGGWDDYIGSFLTIDEAKKRFKEDGFDWGHIVTESEGMIDSFLKPWLYKIMSTIEDIQKFEIYDLKKSNDFYIPCLESVEGILKEEYKD